MTLKQANLSWETLKYSYKYRTLPKHRFLFTQAECFSCKSLTVLQYFKGLTITFCQRLTELLLFKNTSRRTVECVKRNGTLFFFLVQPLFGEEHPSTLRRGNLKSNTHRSFWIIWCLFLEECRLSRKTLHVYLE